MEFVTATSKEEIENAIKILKQMLEMLKKVKGHRLSTLIYHQQF